MSKTNKSRARYPAC